MCAALSPFLFSMQERLIVALHPNISYTAWKKRIINCEGTNFTLQATLLCKDPFYVVQARTDRAGDLEAGRRTEGWKNKS